MPSPLTALSPLDGRYAAKTRSLQDHFSEFALMRERVAVEVAWLLALADDPAFRPLAAFSPGTRDELERAASGFSMTDAQRMYRSRGFIERSPYEGSEIPEHLQRHWLFFERDL